MYRIIIINVKTLKLPKIPLDSNIVCLQSKIMQPKNYVVIDWYVQLSSKVGENWYMNSIYLQSDICMVIDHIVYFTDN